MPVEPRGERQLLLGALNAQREHVLKAIEGLGEPDLRRPVLPSGWTCLGLVNHLSFDVERFWFQAVVAGEPDVVEDVLASTTNAWVVRPDQAVGEVLRRFKEHSEHADAIVTDHSLDAAPAWWPDFFGPWRLHSLRAVILHVVAEIATHAGHLDAARELIDGKLHLVLTE